MTDPPPSSPEPVAAPAGPPGVLPLSAEDLQFWRAELERSDQLREQVLTQWDVAGNLQRYTPQTVRKATEKWEVNVGKDFSDVERKKAALFYDTPEVALVPDPGTDGSVLQLHQELLNSLLSARHMDAKATVLPALQDCLVAVQPVPTEIGYHSVSVDVEQPGAVDPLTGLPGPPTRVPVIVHEAFFWRKLSPKAQVLPVLLRDAKYDGAPWLGYRWRKSLSQVRREYGLGPEWTGGSDSAPDKPYFETLGAPAETGEPMRGGVKLWYRAAYRDATVTHPEVIRVLELIDGLDEPVVHQALPYQVIGPDGRLTPDSLIGYPLHPLALRDLTDAAWIAADCTLTGPLTRELNRFRTDIIQRRDGSKNHLLFDTSKVNQEVRDKIEQGDAPTMIPVEQGALEGGVDRIIQQVPPITLGRESYLGGDIIQRDRDGILGMNQNTQNPSGEGGKTATEVQTVQRNTEARFEQERQRVLQWWLAGVQKISALVLRYGDRIATEILGPQRGAIWLQAREAGQFARFGFEIVIDSGAYVDIEARKRQDLQLYNMTAKDPTLNRSVIQARLATDFGLDPAAWLVTQPPEQKPEPPSVSISVKPEDLDPALPSYVGTYAILTAAGVKGLPPPTYVPPVAPTVPEHGGMAELTPRLNQHQLAETGENPGPKVM